MNSKTILAILTATVSLVGTIIDILNDNND